MSLFTSGLSRKSCPHWWSLGNITIGGTRSLIIRYVASEIPYRSSQCLVRERLCSCCIELPKFFYLLFSLFRRQVQARVYIMRDTLAPKAVPVETFVRHVYFSKISIREFNPCLQLKKSISIDGDLNTSILCVNIQIFPRAFAISLKVSSFQKWTGTPVILIQKGSFWESFHLLMVPNVPEQISSGWNDMASCSTPC